MQAELSLLDTRGIAPQLIGRKTAVDAGGLVSGIGDG
jgi:hypothetical protein